jgi:hypothetical protein
MEQSEQTPAEGRRRFHPEWSKSRRQPPLHTPITAAILIQIVTQQENTDGNHIKM